MHPHVALRFVPIAGLLILISAGRLTAQSAPAPDRFPVAPRPLGDDEEIALAMTAAPSEISSAADIYVLRADGVVKARAGTNGCACMVGRDLHDGSRYPICFDREAARTIMQREIKELTLRAAGQSEAEVQRAITAAYQSGEMQAPRKAAMAYMMSSKQVLFSSPTADGQRVGAWNPHVMIAMPYATASQFGLATSNSSVDVLSLDHEGEASAELVVKVLKWADGTPVALPARR